ncbi:hypothetical protein MUK42_35694 [Musa troglodytarum]|uniref:Secreted protein n=1 Tax=Musa troglodytarum TaxID=320322 RepID=A0A9E7EC62_9LILI|nr:hypothetical protein MUK42_35694 [Musa troglodytarum]
MERTLQIELFLALLNLNLLHLTRPDNTATAEHHGMSSTISKQRLCPNLVLQPAAFGLAQLCIGMSGDFKRKMMNAVLQIVVPIYNE